MEHQVIVGAANDAHRMFWGRMLAHTGRCNAHHDTPTNNTRITSLVTRDVVMAGWHVKAVHQKRRRVMLCLHKR
jgi:hypothetical protein